MENRVVKRREQLGETGIAALPANQPAGQGPGGSGEDLAAFPVWRDHLVDSRPAWTDRAANRATHVIAEQQSIASNDAQVALHRPALEGHDQRAGHGAAGDDRVDRSDRAHLDGPDPGGPRSGSGVQHAEQQINRVRENVEQLEVGTERGATGDVAHRAEGEVTLDVDDRTDPRQVMLDDASGRLVEKLVPGSDLEGTLRGQPEQLFGLGCRFGERLLDIDVKARFQRLSGQSGVGDRRRDDMHRVGPRRLDQLGQMLEHRDVGESGRRGFARGGRRIGHSDDLGAAGPAGRLDMLERHAARPHHPDAQIHAALRSHSRSSQARSIRMAQSP